MEITVRLNGSHGLVLDPKSLQCDQDQQAPCDHTWWVLHLTMNLTLSRSLYTINKTSNPEASNMLVGAQETIEIYLVISVQISTARSAFRGTTSPVLVFLKHNVTRQTSGCLSSFGIQSQTKTSSRLWTTHLAHKVQYQVTLASRAM